MAEIRHAGITTQDMTKSLMLYENIFGFEVVWNEIEEGPFIDNLTGMSNVKVHTVKLKDQKGSMIELLHFISHPDSELELNKLRMLNNVGCSHIAITVDDIQQTYLKLKDLGFVFNNKPERPPGNDSVIVAYCRDHEGTFIEIVELIK